MEWIPLASMVIAILLILLVAIWLENRKQAKRRTLIVPDERSWSFLPWQVNVGFLLVVVLAVVVSLFALFGCENHNAEPSSVSGADSEHIAFPAFPNFPALPKPPGGTVSTTETVATTPAATTPVSTGTTTEQCKYAGRFNGDRMTAYCSKKMSQYPATITIIIPGCITKTISNNGRRYESGGLIVKQSEVYGRGMAIVMASSCKSTSASVRY